MDTRTWLAALAVAASAGCASVTAAPRPGAAVETGPVADARRADEAALAAAGERMGFLQDHFVTVAGGSLLGGSMLVEDAARLATSLPPPLHHAFLFRAGEEGDRSWSLPAIYAGAGIAGNGLLRALGVSMTHDPASGAVTLRGATREARFTSPDGGCRAVFRLRPASGAAPARDVTLVLATGFPETACLGAEDASALALATSEIPGRATLVESLTGRRVECRRALVRVEIPDLGAAALVDVMYVEAAR